MSLHTGFRRSVIVTISDAAMKNVFFDLFFSASGRPESCVCTAWRGDHLLDLLADKSSINMLRGRLITGLSVSKLPTFLRNPAFVYKNAYLAIKPNKPYIPNRHVKHVCFFITWKHLPVLYKLHKQEYSAEGTLHVNYIIMLDMPYGNQAVTYFLRHH